MNMALSLETQTGPIKKSPDTVMQRPDFFYCLILFYPAHPGPVAAACIVL
jgi:hypothetical protein